MVNDLGNDVYGLSTKVPWRNDSGEIIGIVGLNRDITDYKRAEAEARRAQEQLIEHQRKAREHAEAELAKLREELVRHTRLVVLGQLAGSIAHELRNPLGSIRNAAFFLKEDAADIKTQWAKHLDIIDGEVNGADRIINNLLEMFRVRETKKEEVDLSRTVQIAWDQASMPDGVRHHIEFDPNPFIVKADLAQLVQVLTNVMLNARQVIGKRGDVWVAAGRVGGYDEIVIRDSGSGVPTAHRNRIFEPLFTTKTRATGLGLSICRQIIERHGGTLDLLEEEGSGAAFRIRIPQKEDGPA